MRGDREILDDNLWHVVQKVRGWGMSFDDILDALVDVQSRVEHEMSLEEDG